MDLEAELSAPPGVGGRHPLPAPATFEHAMRRIGLNREAPIVVYDGANSLAAARLWWLLTDAGQAAYGCWTVASRRGARRGCRSNPAPAYRSPPAISWRSRGSARRSGPEIEARLGGGPTVRLVDVRAPDAIRVETEPIDPVAGHIPGAVNLPSPGNHAADGRFLPAAIIADRYRDAGVASEAVLYCGSGITAAQSLLALESAGLTAAIYPGSWSDWITDPDRPIATGPD